MKFPDKTLKFNFNHSTKAINSLITQLACVYLDLLPHVKQMLTEIYAGKLYFIIQSFSKSRLFIYKIKIKTVFSIVSNFKYLI